MLCLMNERKTIRNKWKWVSQQLLISECMLNQSLIVNRKMKYWIAMSTIFTISIMAYQTGLLWWVRPGYILIWLVLRLG